MCGGCYSSWRYKNNFNNTKVKLLYYKKRNQKRFSFLENLRQREKAIPFSIRGLIISRAKGICEECGQTTKMMNIHHKDKNSNPRGLSNKKSNNKLSNLIYLCLRCHIDKHREDLIRGKLKRFGKNEQMTFAR